METLFRLLGADEEWERPLPTRQERRNDLQMAGVWLIVTIIGIEALRGLEAFSSAPSPVWGTYAFVVTGVALLVWRRSHPLVVLTLSALHMFITGLISPGVMASFPMQVLYFFALYSGVAWARDRRVMTMLVAGVLLLMTGWLSWQYAMGMGINEIQELYGGDAGESNGLLPPVQSSVVYTTVINAVYFFGAILLGQISWRGALRSAQVREQTETIRCQAHQLRDQAVVAERLRIARELHDVVAHHVSVIGVQAAAARRVLDHDTEAARQALTSVEGSSRDAVGQMRELLGALRTTEQATEGSGDSENAESRSRAPQPGLADLQALVDGAQAPGLSVRLTRSESQPGAWESVPAAAQLSIYRTVQEALTNVRRHSTAQHVTVTVRVGDDTEVEIVDDGQARQGTGGSGLGLVGIRERAQYLGGTAEIGPRHGGGYRVRVRFPAMVAP